MALIYEYRVMEQSSNEPSQWYLHGYQGIDKEEAEKKLKDMQDYYGKYDRNFRLEYRTVSDWEVDIADNG